MFNLKIEDYSFEELEELFALKGIQYSKETLKISYLRVVNHVNQTSLSSDFNSQTKKNTTLFLEKVYSILNNRLESNDNVLNFTQSNLYSTSQPVIINDKLKNPTPNNVTDSLPNIASSELVVTFDSRFRDDLTQNTNNFTLSFREVFKNTTSVALKNIFTPNLLLHVAKELGNNFLTIEINGIRKVVEFPDIKIPTFEEINSDTIVTLFQTFNASIHKNKGLFSHLIIVPEGVNKLYDRCLVYYDFESLINEIESDIESDAQNTNNTNISDISVKLYFNKNNTDQEDYKDIRQKLGYVLGFRKDEYSYNFTFENKTFLSESTIEYNSIRYAYLVFDDLQNNGNPNVYTNEVTYVGCQGLAPSSGKVLAILDFSKQSTGTANDRFADINYKRHYFSKADLKKFNISLIDEFGRLLQVLNGDWSFTAVINQKKF